MRGSTASCFTSCSGSTCRTGVWSIDTPRMRRAGMAAGDDRVRVSVAPHAPYSVSPELFRAIRDEVDASSVPITSVHLGESTSEMEFLQDGTGPVAGHAALGWRVAPTMAAAGRGPVEYLDQLGVLDAQTLVVHGVQLDDEPSRAGADRRYARDLSAQQSVGRCRCLRRSRASTRRVWRWPSAPTAWPASRI